MLGTILTRRTTYIRIETPIKIDMQSKVTLCSLRRDRQTETEKWEREIQNIKTTKLSI